ncbi:MAG: type II toxin-antitoxin system HicA family toxin [Candidatus Acidiferrales bacterium]
MTPKFPAVSTKELARIAERLGFKFRRQRGSHAIYVRVEDQARVVIPMHAGDLKRKTPRAIVDDLKLSLEQFRELLR